MTTVENLQATRVFVISWLYQQVCRPYYMHFCPCPKFQVMSTSTQSLNVIDHFLFNLKSVFFSVKSHCTGTSKYGKQRNKQGNHLCLNGSAKIPYKSTFQLSPPRRKILGQFLGSQKLLAEKWIKLQRLFMVNPQCSQQRLLPCHSPIPSKHLVSNTGCNTLGPIFSPSGSLVLKMTVARLVCGFVMVQEMASAYFCSTGACSVQWAAPWGARATAVCRHPRQLRNKQRRWDLTVHQRVPPLMVP